MTQAEEFLKMLKTTAPNSPERREGVIEGMSHMTGMIDLKSGRRVMDWDALPVFRRFLSCK